MIGGQQLTERIQKTVGVPSQSRSDGFSDVILFGSGETTVTGIATTFTPTLEELARDMQAKLKTRSMRLVGDPKVRVTKLAHAGHYIQQCMQALPHVDVLIVFECREWEAAEYVRDAIASGQKKALIQLPHEGGEKAGMEECAALAADICD